MKSSRWHWNTNAAHTILKGHIHWRRLLRSRCHIIYQTILQYCILYSIFPALYVPCFFLNLCAKFGFYLMPSAALALLPLNHKFLFITHKSFLIFCFFFFVVCGAHVISANRFPRRRQRQRDRERGRAAEWERFGYRRTALWLCLLGEIAISDVFLSPNNAVWVCAGSVCAVCVNY